MRWWIMDKKIRCQHCKADYLQKPLDDHPSYLECPTCGALQLTYEPMDYQEVFHRTPYKLNDDGSIKNQTFGIFGGYGSAKSTASLHEFFIRALENPGGVGLITAPTLQLLKRTSIKTLLDEIIPPPMLESYNKTEGTMRLANGFEIYAIPSDDEEKLRSINAGLIHMEEASGIKRSIYDQLLTRMRNKYTRNRAIFVCSNPDMGWIKDVIVNNAQRANPTHPEHEHYDDTMECYIWPTELNKHLPPDFIEKLSKNKPEWWIARFLKGSFEHSSGMVYPNVAKAVIEDIPEFDKLSKSWERCISADFGIRNPTVVLFGAIDPENGILYIYHCYYQANTLLPHHAKAIKPLIEAIPNGLIRFMVGDPSMRNKSADVLNGKSVQGLYQEYNLYFSEGNNNMEAGIMRLNSYIDRGKLKIFRSCVDLVREMLGYKYPEVSMDEEKNLDERPIKRDDHAPDALRYMVMRLPEDPDMLTAPHYDVPDRWGRTSSDPDEFDEDDEMELDFLSYV